MSIASITSKNQISIPAEVRRTLNLNKGDRLSFESLDDGAYIVRKASLRKSDGAALPYLKSRQRPLSDDSIREAIRKGALAS